MAAGAYMWGASCTRPMTPQKELLLVWGLLTILVVITYFIQRYRWHLVPPSGIAMVLGMVAGLIFRLSGA